MNQVKVLKQQYVEFWGCLVTFGVCRMRMVQILTPHTIPKCRRSEINLIYLVVRETMTQIQDSILNNHGKHKLPENVLPVSQITRDVERIEVDI